MVVSLKFHSVHIVKNGTKRGRIRAPTAFQTMTIRTISRRSCPLHSSATLRNSPESSSLNSILDHYRLDQWNRQLTNGTNLDTAGQGMPHWQSSQSTYACPDSNPPFPFLDCSIMTTLTELYRDYFRSIAAFISRKYPMLDAEDIAQSTYVKYWKRFPDGNCGEREPFRVLLYLARLCAVNAIRKATRFRRSEQLRRDTEITLTVACGPISTTLDDIPPDLRSLAADLMAGYSCESLWDKYGGQYRCRTLYRRLRDCLAN